jgi:pimeloyl-ACP methyl ester carboxylesterase
MLVLGFKALSKSDISETEIKDKYADHESKYLEVNGMQVHYKIEGNGEDVLVLLHGTGASLHTWDGWVEKMKDSLTLIRLDLPAYGITGPFPDRDYSLEHYLSFLDQFTSALGLDSFHMAGNSFGGFLAWNYVLDYPGKVKKLILVDASGYPSNHTVGVFKLAKNPITASILKRITPRSFMEKNLKEVYGQDSLISESLIDRYWHMTLRAGNRQAFIDRVNTPFAERHHLVPQIRKPTLILWGDQDTWIDVDHASLFQRDIQESQLIMYKGIGHTPMEEAPELSARDVLAFILRK